MNYSCANDDCNRRVSAPTMFCCAHCMAAAYGAPCVGVRHSLTCDLRNNPPVTGELFDDPNLSPFERLQRMRAFFEMRLNMQLPREVVAVCLAVEQHLEIQASWKD